MLTLFYQSGSQSGFGMCVASYHWAASENASEHRRLLLLKLIGLDAISKYISSQKQNQDEEFEEAKVNLVTSPIQLSLANLILLNVGMNIWRTRHCTVFELQVPAGSGNFYSLGVYIPCYTGFYMQLHKAPEIFVLFFYLI